MSTTEMDPEIITFYIDITGDDVKRRRLSKALEEFVEEKKKKNSLSEFRVFYFQEGSDPYISDDFSDEDTLHDIIKNKWNKNRETSQNLMENGLFFCLSKIAQEASKKKEISRIIILSDGASKKGSEYNEAVMDLVETVRTFPTFIDIIRIGEKEFYKDDVELQIISRVTSGGLFYIKKDKQFKDILEGLAKNKKLPDLRPEGGQAIDADKKKYYENLAVSLKPPKEGSGVNCSLCDQDLCTYCDEETDIPMVCPECGFAYHECCAALHSWKFNIGLKYIFRCINCGALIKLNEEHVYLINGEPFEKKEKTKKQLELELEDEETWSPTDSPEDAPMKGSNNEVMDKKSKTTMAPPGIDIGEESIDKEGSNHSPKSKGNGKIKMGLFGIQRVPKKKKKSSSSNGHTGEKLKNISKGSKSDEKEKGDSSPKKKDITARLRKRRSKRKTITYCPFCAKQISSDKDICPHCGSPIN